MDTKANLFFLADVVRVSDLVPLTGGKVREIYAFPGRSDLLIKVKTEHANIKRHKLAKRLAWRVFKDAQYRNMLKEIECEMKVAMKVGAQIENSPLPRMLGVVQTDRGSGLVVEKILGDENGLARHLNALCQRQSLTEVMLDQLNRFVARIYDLQIVARDIHAKNIVYGQRGADTGFFLVDGYGERNLVPLRTLSRNLNNRSLDRQFKDIGRSTGLNWDQSRRIFGFN